MAGRQPAGPSRFWRRRCPNGRRRSGHQPGHSRCAGVVRHSGRRATHRSRRPGRRRHQTGCDRCQAHGHNQPTHARQVHLITLRPKVVPARTLQTDSIRARACASRARRCHCSVGLPAPGGTGQINWARLAFLHLVVAVVYQIGGTTVTKSSVQPGPVAQPGTNIRTDRAGAARQAAAASKRDHAVMAAAMLGIMRRMRAPARTADRERGQCPGCEVGAAPARYLRGCSGRTGASAGGIGEHDADQGRPGRSRPRREARAWHATLLFVIT